LHERVVNKLHEPNATYKHQCGGDVCDEYDVCEHIFQST
jgi:hypothetical protein